MKNKFISNRVIKLNDGTIFFTSDKNRPTRDEIYFIDFWRENLGMYRIKMNPCALRLIIIDHFTVVCSVTWPLNGTEATSDL